MTLCIQTVKVPPQMGKIPCQQRPLRIPLPFDGIQVNGCRKPTCENFLALSSIKIFDRTDDDLPEAYQRGGGSCRVSGTGMGRIWHGYSACNPEMYTIMGDIFRIPYSYFLGEKEASRQG